MSETTEPVVDRGWQRLEVIFTCLLLLFVAAMLVSSLSLNRRSGLFPWFVIYPTLVLALWQLLDDIRGKTSSLPVEESEADAEAPDAVVARRRGAGIVAWVLGFFASIWLLGFAIGGALASWLYLKLATRERWRTGLIYLVAMWLMLEIIFRQVLSLPFPPGAVFQAFDFDPRFDLGIRL